jgi:hypothetical protein
VPTPNELQDKTLASLREARKQMLSAGFDIRLSTQPEEKKEEANKALLDVERTIRTLENKELEDIRDKLVANEKDLLDGISGLNKARERLESVQSFLEAVGKVLDVVAKIVK